MWGWNQAGCMLGMWPLPCAIAPWAALRGRRPEELVFEAHRNLGAQEGIGISRGRPHLQFFMLQAEDWGPVGISAEVKKPSLI